MQKKRRGVEEEIGIKATLHGDGKIESFSFSSPLFPFLFFKLYSKYLYSEIIYIYIFRQAERERDRKIK